MKFGLNNLSSFVLLLFMIIKNCNTATFNMKAMEDLKLDNMEVSSMLNDPKFANMGDELSKLQSSREEMEKTGKELKSMGIDVGAKATSSSSMGNDGLPPSDLIKLDSGKKKSLLEDNDALSKLGNLKELGLNEDGEDDEKKKKEQEKKKREEAIRKEEEEKKRKENSKLKNIDTLTRSQAHLLLDVLKQPSFFEIIPQEAQKIVKVKLIVLNIFIKILSRLLLMVQF